MKLNEKLFLSNASGKRYVIHQGGTRSGKTYSILQFIVLYMLSHRRKRISIAGQSYPHLAKGVITDIKDMVSHEGWDEYFKENKTAGTYTCITTGSYIEFFYAGSPAKLRGPKRDVLFVNECNTISWEAFRQLDVRTTSFTFLDFNPVSRFWVHNKLMPLVNDTEHVFAKSTYKDNKYLSFAEIANIERQKVNVVWWRIYGEGETGNPEGRVFTNWSVTDSSLSSRTGELLNPGSKTAGLPGKLLGYGIDFGFSHSPTAVVQVNECDGALWVKEHFYSTGTHNEELFNHLKGVINLAANAYADPSAPQTIDYLYRKGWKGLRAAGGGRDSVEMGINLLLERFIHVTAESRHLIYEMQEYEWDRNKEGEYTSRPKKANDHAIDAMRYVVSSPAKKTLVFA